MWMNVLCLVGRATSDPKARTTAGGTTYATVRIAVPKGRGRTGFYTVELWGKLAQVAFDHVRKGGLLSLRCELDPKQWESDGARRERLAIVVKQLGLILANSTVVFNEDAAADLIEDDQQAA